ncbi:MAG TPA: hypothetical protein VIL46_12540, partial [Gemmataceae bacterium]
YVGITATDARDRIFLAGLVRRHCPDTQLLMVGADILFAHPDVRDQLKGTLVGTEYPLYTDNQDWTSPRGAATRPPRRIQFASPAQQGFYNAVLALRRPPEDAELPLLEHAVPFAEAVPYREPGEDAHKPPVWISVVGNGRLWPLQCRGLDRALHHLKSEGVISEQQRERYAEYTYGGSGEAAGKAKGALREGRRPYPMATFGLDRPSLSLLVVLLVFGVGNVQFYFGRFRWSGARLFRLPSPAPPGAALIPQLRRGAARLLDLARSSAAARLPKEGMGEGAPGDQAPLVAPQVRYVLVCLLPLWVLLTALAVLACVPLVADCSFVTLAWDVPAQWLDVLLSVAAGSLVLAATGGALAWGIEATRAREEGRAVRGPLRRVGQASVVFLGGLVLVLLAVGWWFKPEDLGLLRSDVRLETLVLLGALLAGGGLLAVLADLSWAPGRAWAAKLFACLAAQMVLVIPVFAALLRVLGEGPEGVGEHHPVEALTNALLFYDRTIRHLFSGVSLFVMGALLALAFYAWGACQLRRLFRLAGSAPLAPWPESAGHPDGHAAQAYARITERIARNSQRLRDLLLSPGATLWAHAKGAFVIAVAVAAAWAVRMYWYALPPYEFRAAWLLWFGLVAFLFAWVLMLLQVVMTSNRLRKILKQLAFLPLKGAFGRVPEQVRGLLSRFLTGRRTRLSHCRIPVQYLGELARTAGEVAPRSGAGSAWEGFDPKGEYERAAAEFQKQ